MVLLQIALLDVMAGYLFYTWFCVYDNCYLWVFLASEHLKVKVLSLNMTWNSCNFVNFRTGFWSFNIIISKSVIPDLFLTSRNSKIFSPWCVFRWHLYATIVKILLLSAYQWTQYSRFHFDIMYQSTITWFVTLFGVWSCGMLRNTVHEHIFFTRNVLYAHHLCSGIRRLTSLKFSIRLFGITFICLVPRFFDGIEIYIWTFDCGLWKPVIYLIEIKDNCFYFFTGYAWLLAEGHIYMCTRCGVQQNWQNNTVCRFLITYFQKEVLFGNPIYLLMRMECCVRFLKTESLFHFKRSFRFFMISLRRKYFSSSYWSVPWEIW